MSVGSKIKNLRKKHNMTQKELADGIITRGMLSRIEGGTALPSMQTLRALADRLQISPGFLLEDGDDLLPAERARIKKTILEEYRSGNLRDCLTIFAYAALETDAEFSAIFVSCAFATAMEDFHAGNFSSSLSLLQKAEASLPHLLSPLKNVSARRIAFLRSVMEHIATPEEIIADTADTPDFGFQPALFFFALKLVRSEQYADVSFLIRYGNFEPPYLAYIQAQLLISEYKFIDAILTMKSLVTQSECPLFLKLLCHSCMENCCKLCEDYKGAYENHLKHRELLASIH